MFKRLYIKIYFKLFPAKRLRKSGAKVGKNIFFGEAFYTELENAKLLEIKDGVVFAAFSKIILHDSSLDNVIKNYGVKYGKVIIGKNSYIGAGAIILPGTIIGDNTIIGAGSVVKGVLKKDSVYAGCPAKFIETVSQMKSKWKKNSGNLTFIKKLKQK